MPKAPKTPSTKKTPVGDASVLTSTKSRKLKKSRYSSFKLQKSIKHAPDDVLPSGFQLLKQTFRLLLANWRTVGMFFLVFGVINLIVAQSLASSDDIAKLKSSIHDLLGGDWSQMGASAALLVMLGTASSSQSTAGASYQLVWVIMGSLAFIWLLREMYAKNKVRVRMSFYRGMYPLVPFLLVLLVMGLELLPATLAGTIFSTLMSNGIASTLVEQIIWTLVCGLVAFITLFLLCSSVFALYIACLPDMTPLRALRSARELVTTRRSMILRKLLYLPFALLIIGIIVMAPLVLFATPLAIGAFFLLNIAALIVLHGYLYTLYRALL